MAVSTNQWLTFRTALADWKTNQQTEKFGPASLLQQEPGLSSHPLFLGRAIFPIGLIKVAGETLLLSEIRRTTDDLGSDMLSNELLQPVLTEDGIPLFAYDL